ncbi:MAG: ADOP family duplicated permease [Thermoanaerobaculia bacterium]
MIAGGFGAVLQRAGRSLARRRAQSLAALFTLMLGIGALSTLAAVIRTVLLAPLPYRDPASLVLVWGEIRGLDYQELWLSGPEYLDLAAEAGVFEELALLRPRDLSATGAGEPQALKAVASSASLFRLLGVPPLAGRTFLPGEDEPGRPKIAVLAYATALRLFGGAERAVGAKLTLNGEDYAVVGVMPAGFRILPPDGLLPRGVDLWVPIGRDLSRMPRDGWVFNALGRLKPGLAPEAAQERLRALTGRISREHAEAYQGQSWEVVLSPYQRFLTRHHQRPLWLLFALTCLVLGVAGVNVANLLLSAAVSAEPEHALETALGASRWRLARQSLAEGLLLAAGGGALGLALAAGACRLLAAWGPRDVPRLDRLGLDGWAVAITLGAVLLVGLLAGLPPAWQAARPSLGQVLRSGERGAGGGLAARRLLSGLVLAQVALALVPLAAAGLLAKSFYHLSAVALGFEVERVFTFKVQMPSARFNSEENKSALFERIADELEALPGVSSVGAVSHLPLSGAFAGATFEASGDRAGAEAKTQADLFLALPGYFETLAIPLAEGRGFNALDGAKAARVAVVDETLARRLWPGRRAVGQRLRFLGFEDPAAGAEANGAWYEVVGVCRAIRHLGPGEEPREHVYFPDPQLPWNQMFFVLRTGAGAPGLETAVAKAVARVDPAQAASDLRPFARYLDEARARPRFQLVLMASLATLTLVLVALGLYGVMAYLLARRVREVGIRQALGSGRGQLAWALIRPGLVLGAAGVAAGLLLSLAAAGLLATLLYGVASRDPLVFGGATVLLFAVIAVASYLPARRLLGLPLVTALRQG